MHKFTPRYSHVHPWMAREEGNSFQWLEHVQKHLHARVPGKGRAP